MTSSLKIRYWIGVTLSPKLVSRISIQKQKGPEGPPISRATKIEPNWSHTIATASFSLYSPPDQGQNTQRRSDHWSHPNSTKEYLWLVPQFVTCLGGLTCVWGIHGRISTRSKGAEFSSTPHSRKLVKEWKVGRLVMAPRKWETRGCTCHIRDRR